VSLDEKGQLLLIPGSLSWHEVVLEDHAPIKKLTAWKTKLQNHNSRQCFHINMICLQTKLLTPRLFPLPDADSSYIQIPICWNVSMKVLSNCRIVTLIQ